MTRRGEAGFLNNSCRNRIHGRLADRPVLLLIERWHAVQGGTAAARLCSPAVEMRSYVHDRENTQRPLSDDLEGRLLRRESHSARPAKDGEGGRVWRPQGSLRETP